MRRLLALFAAAAALLAACGGEPVAAPTPSRSATSTSSTNPSAATSSPPAGASMVTSAAPSPGDVVLPPDAPRTFARQLDAQDLPLEALAPPGAGLGATWRGVVLTPSGSGTTQAVAFSWTRGDGVRPGSGLEVWERGDSTAVPPWQAVFAFTDRRDSGVFGVRFEVGDLTRDRSSDLLAFEDLGGSGACGVWRVIELQIGTTEEIYRAQTCDTDVRIVDGDLHVRESVYGAGDAHCCPSAYRTTILRWNGQGWVIVRRTTTPA